MTIFAKIIAGEIPCKKIYEDEHILSFYDIHPHAKVHALIIPKQTHLKRLQDATAEDQPLLGHMMAKIPHIASLLGLEEGGYRLITNNGDYAGQEVPHLHFHLLGGEPLGKLRGCMC